MDLLNGQTREEYLKRLEKTQSGLGAGMQRRKKKTLELKRHGMVSEEYSRRIYPLDFTVPFNPMDLEDETYDSDYKFIFPGSATTGYLAFRSIAREKPEVLKKLSTLTGMPKEVFTRTKSESGEDLPATFISKEEITAMKKWRLPKSGSAPVYATQFSDRKNTLYSTLHLADIVLDKDGQVDEDFDTGLFWKLYLIETECLATEVKALKATFEPGGINAHLSGEDQKNQVKALWNSRLISKPYYKYAVRYLHIVCDNQTYSPNKEDMLSFNAGRFKDFDCIKLSGYDFLGVVKSAIGTPKDKFFDFIEMEFQNPEIPKSDEQQKGKYAEKVTKGQVHPSDSISVAPAEDTRAYFQDFEVKYREYLDNSEMWNDSVIKSNVREFSAIKDETLLSKFMFDIGRYGDIVSSEEVQKLFVLAGVDSSELVKDQLMSEALAGETKKFTGKVVLSASDRVDEMDMSKLKAEDATSPEEETVDFTALMGDVLVAVEPPAVAMSEAPVTATAVAPVAEEVAGTPATGTEMEAVLEEDVFAALKM